MKPTKGYAVQGPESKFEPFNFERRELGARDVLIEISYCGICHSDIHQARNEWGNSVYPMVPGHEIVGRVAQVGAEVSKFNVGDVAGVGCFVDSCRTCENCNDGFEQFCRKHLVMTYNGFEADGKTLTFGGYSAQIVVDENYTLKISAKENLANIAPLLCAGITTYTPLKRFNVRAGQKVGIVGLGGPRHVGAKAAVSTGGD